MDNTKVIMELCGIIHAMNDIIERQAVELNHYGALHLLAEETKAARQAYASTTGEELATSEGVMG